MLKNNPKVWKTLTKAVFVPGLILAVIAAFYLTGRVRAAAKSAPIDLTQKDQALLTLLEENVLSGGPPKDGIPAIEKPQYVTAAEADRWLVDNDIVFGLAFEGFIAAYPQRILVWHEIVNEKVNSKDISLTYCPLTGTAIGYRGEFQKETSTTFGVSGKLVNSNLIIYDRSSDSYWPQILGQAIKGPYRGYNLKQFPVIWTTWKKWKKQYPKTKVLSKKTGSSRNYGKDSDPYGSYLTENGGYYTSDEVYFQPIFTDQRLSPKTVVIGIRDDQKNALAISRNLLRDKKQLETKLGDYTLIVTNDPALDFPSVKIKETGERINAFYVMWFAWAAYYPDTLLIQ